MDYVVCIFQICSFKTHWMIILNSRVNTLLLLFKNNSQGYKKNDVIESYPCLFYEQYSVLSKDM